MGISGKHLPCPPASWCSHELLLKFLSLHTQKVSLIPHPAQARDTLNQPWITSPCHGRGSCTGQGNGAGLGTTFI